ncbi:MAG: type II toxin-antitoxin system VapC family toxin [Acidobacteria bacterium]|nr:type II toxin-antitoxin system VapC family toxin [Acidobacteriota bacterium]
MSVVYADTSALARVWFSDEPDHREISQIVLDGDDFIITSELARPEFASAVYAASRDGRLSEPKAVLHRFDADCGEKGSIALLPLEPSSIFPSAVRLLGLYPLRTLDAIHLAVALEEKGSAGEDFALLTRDDRQGEAAGAEGLLVL